MYVCGHTKFTKTKITRPKYEALKSIPIDCWNDGDSAEAERDDDDDEAEKTFSRRNARTGIITSCMRYHVKSASDFLRSPNSPSKSIISFSALLNKFRLFIDTLTQTQLTSSMEAPYDDDGELTASGRVVAAGADAVSKSGHSMNL